MIDQLDGRIGEGWGGTSPNGSHDEAAAAALVERRDALANPFYTGD